MPKSEATRAAIERLKTNPQPYWEMSLILPSQCVSNEAEVKAFIYAARVHGKVKWATLGRDIPSSASPSARRLAGQTAEAMRQGIDPTAAKRAARTSPRESSRRWPTNGSSAIRQATDHPVGGGPSHA